MQLLLDGVPVTFGAQPADQDTSRREWVLTWQGQNGYAAGNHQITVKLEGQTVTVLEFTVSDVARLDNLMAFPNPFDDELGTRFSFSYSGDQSFDLLIRVFTVSGHLIYQREERGLAPGYHQIAWDGRDADGDKIANGIYFYKLLAKGSGKTLVEQGRLVKLRKPHRVADTGDLGTTP